MLNTIIYSIIIISIIILSGFALFYMIKKSSPATPSKMSQLNPDYSTQQDYTSYTLPHNQPYQCNKQEQYIIRRGPRIYTELPFGSNIRKARKNVRSLFSPTEAEIKKDGLHYKIK
jgi:hypothetical protein